MAEFKAFSRKVEVKGAAVLAIVEGMRGEDLASSRAQALRILAQSGIAALEEESWYPQQQVLDALQAVFTAAGRDSVRAIGRKLPDVAEFPPGITAVPTALRAIDVAHRMNHRGALHLGSYRFEQIAERQAHVACHNPYPCDLDLGLIEGTVQRFTAPQDAASAVEHLPGRCRSRGDLSCTYSVRW